eukprot:145908-Rhodomonas_salina.1
MSSLDALALMCVRAQKRTSTIISNKKDLTHRNLWLQYLGNASDDLKENPHASSMCTRAARAAHSIMVHHALAVLRAILQGI